MEMRPTEGDNLFIFNRLSGPTNSFVIKKEGVSTNYEVPPDIVSEIRKYVIDEAFQKSSLNIDKNCYSGVNINNNYGDKYVLVYFKKGNVLGWVKLDDYVYDRCVELAKSGISINR